MKISSKWQHFRFSVMACRLADTKPLYEPVLHYCQLETCRLQNGGHFSGLQCVNAFINQGWRLSQPESEDRRVITYTFNTIQSSRVCCMYAFRCSRAHLKWLRLRVCNKSDDEKPSFAKNPPGPYYYLNLCFVVFVTNITPISSCTPVVNTRSGIDVELISFSSASFTIYMKNALFMIGYYLSYASIYISKYLYLIFTCITFSAISPKNDLRQAYIFVSQHIWTVILMYLCMAIKFLSLSFST